jgi:hypothetical protein
VIKLRKFNVVEVIIILCQLKWNNLDIENTYTLFVPVV